MTDYEVQKIIEAKDEWKRRALRAEELLESNRKQMEEWAAGLRWLRELEGVANKFFIRILPDNDRRKD
jgi:hypothetical protein